MQMSISEKEIAEQVISKFGKYIKHFVLKIGYPVFGSEVSIWNFNFSYKLLLDETTQMVSDGVEIGDTKAIVERVWLSLIAATENSNDRRKDETKNSIIRVGESLGFISPDNQRR